MPQATLILVVVGLVWRIVLYAMAAPLWSDEAFVAINFLTRDLKGLARPLEFDQIVPPGFLWAEWAVVQVFGTGERALRLVPFLAGVASLLLFRRFCRQVASPPAALLAVAVLATSVFPVRHANEVKQYSTDLLVSLVLIMLGWGAWREERPSWRWLALIGAAAVGVWCSYTAVFPASSVALLLAIRVARERSPRLLAFGAAYAVLLGLSFAMVVHTFAEPQARAAAWLHDSVTWRDAFPPLAKPWLLPWWLLDIHAGCMLAYPYGTKNFGSAATFLAVVLGAWSMGRERERRPLLLLLLGAMPVALLAAALRRHPYGTCIRVSIFLAPAICLLAGEGLVAALRARGRLTRGPVIVAGLLALIPIGSTATHLAMPYRRWDDVEHRQLARRLAGDAAPGDRWIVFNGATPPPRHVPDLMVSQWIQQVAEVRFYLTSLAPVPTLWGPDPRDVAPLRGGRTWFLIHRHSCKAAYPEQQLAAYRGALAARLGPPQSAAYHPLPEGSSVEVCVFGR